MFLKILFLIKVTVYIQLGRLTPLVNYWSKTGLPTFKYDLGTSAPAPARLHHCHAVHQRFHSPFKVDCFLANLPVSFPPFSFSSFSVLHTAARETIKHEDVFPYQADLWASKAIEGAGVWVVQGQAFFTGLQCFFLPLLSPCPSPQPYHQGSLQLLFLRSGFPEGWDQHVRDQVFGWRGNEFGYKEQLSN